MSSIRCPWINSWRPCDRSLAPSRASKPPRSAKGELLARGCRIFILAARLTEDSPMNLAPNRHLTRLGVIAVALVAAATLTATARAEEWTKSYTVSGRAQVRVETNDGAVRIATGDGKQVEFRVIYEGYELNKTIHVDSRQDGDNVQVNARVTGHWGFSWGNGRRGPRIEVRMPKNADLQIDTGDGSVETQPLSGHVKIHTGDGSV